MISNTGTTLTQHVLHRQALHPNARGQFSQLITQIGVACKQISAQVRRAGLIEVWGSTGQTNVQGETVQKLDEIANALFIRALTRSGAVSVMASEEEDEIILGGEDGMFGDYVVAFDPLDGSSNIDASVSIGTIFAIYHRRSIRNPGLEDILRPGREQVAAGYVMYGSSTVLVYTAGNSVDSFTLDPNVGEFFLTRSGIKMPEITEQLAINESNECYWPNWVKPFLEEIKARNTDEERFITSRHIGSLVADFHRNLLKGGLYLYPADRRTGRGKLRLLYECNPLAFIAEVAGGGASNCCQRILEIDPNNLHARSGLIIGPMRDVRLAEKFAREHGSEGRVQDGG